MKAWEYRKFDFATRVEMQTRVNQTSGCHDFVGSRDTFGYGQMKDHGRNVLVHRWVWERDNGPLNGLHALHTCDNPACVNPEHLYAGTHTQNMRDKVARGHSKNMPRGKDHHRTMAKATESQAAEIRARIISGERQCDLAAEFGFTRQLVSDIKLNKTWRHVP